MERLEVSSQLAPSDLLEVRWSLKDGYYKKWYECMEQEASDTAAEICYKLINSWME